MFGAVFFALSLVGVGFCRNEKTDLSREKRTLLWQPPNSRVRVITGFGIPVDLSLETVIIGNILRAEYHLPNNISDIKPFGNVYYEKRKKRSMSRWDIYDVLARFWEMRGLGSGKTCILKTICELSHRPVDRTYGLYDELVHAVFNPRGTKEALRDHSDNEYYAAQKLGRKDGDACRTKFSDCELSLVDLFTV